MSRKPPEGKVLPFGSSPKRTDEPFRSLGLSERARRYGVPERQLSGHWCSRCAGIWFGYLLEAECPRCGSRSG